jgi:hypothetical protein
MGSRPRLVAENFSKLPSALNTWEINGRVWSSRRLAPRQTKVASKMGNAELEAVSQRILPEVRNWLYFVFSLRSQRALRASLNTCRQAVRV